MNKRIDSMIEYIRKGGNGGATNDLLEEFFDGYPVKNLLRLLESEEENLVRAGAFIASELGRLVAPIIADLGPYLKHRLDQVRLDLIDPILLCADPSHGSVIANAVRLVNDSDTVVRSRALFMLARIGRGQLLASLEFLDNCDLVDRVNWLASIRSNPQSISDKLSSDSSTDRLFGVAAAVRIALLGGSKSALRAAIRSDDLEVAAFAKASINCEYVLRALSD